MRTGVLGTGDVGGRLGSKLVSLGCEVKMGSRTAQNAKAAEWTKANGLRASAGTFADAGGSVSLEALLVWVRLMATLKTRNLNFKIVR
ncbi:MAG: hypothetical protein ACRD6W_19520 [Nitrososphaerales archaeon]